MEKELELLDKCLLRAEWHIAGAFGMQDDAQLESLFDEIGDEFRRVNGTDADLSIRPWNAACEAVQARRAAA